MVGFYSTVEAPLDDAASKLHIPNPSRDSRFRTARLATSFAGLRLRSARVQPDILER